MIQGDETKFDDGKRMWHLLPLDPVRQIIDVLQYGAIKYKEEGWKEVPDAKDRYYDALMRHVTAWRSGERKDPETGLSHLAHAGCNILFLLWFD